MKLKNKQTGEIREVSNILIDGMFTVNSLAELCEEWEDYEEPKYCYYLDFLFRIQCISLDGFGDTPKNREHFEQLKENGNWFGSREEAEKAAEKLKAWKRLKDKGFRFINFECKKICKYYPDTGVGELEYQVPYYTGMDDDMSLLFGGGE